MEHAKIEQLTNGPKHHLFGFHDLLIRALRSGLCEGWSVCAYR